MRIVEQTPDRLVLEIRPVGLMLLCVGLFLLFFTLGFGMRLVLPSLAGLMGMPQTPMLTNLPSVPGMNALGYASVIPLLVAVFLIKTRRLTFDRPSAKVTITSRGETGYPLADLQGATLAASRSNNSGTTYRAVLQFSGTTGQVPVTPYSTSGPGPSRTVEAINSWLGPRVSVGGGQSINLSGAQAQEALAALEKLGIRLPR
ncbi:hypothetical protein [Tabrizicola sp.]|uniref:hypothetical protein n=1 Tax=Tabrizicola sp. TaxID=2005166 RepID=UPI0035AF7238